MKKETMMGSSILIGIIGIVIIIVSGVNLLNPFSIKFIFAFFFAMMVIIPLMMLKDEEEHREKATADNSDFKTAEPKLKHS